MNIQQTANSNLPSALDSIPTELFIGGKWMDGPERFPVQNPANSEIVTEVSDSGPAEAIAALDAAVAAQSDWRRMAPRARAKLFHKTHSLMLEKAEEFAQIMTLESGKPLTESRAEFNLSADFLLWFSEQIAHLHGTYAESSHGGFRIVTTHQPIGPCLLITPWNFPLLMIVRKAGAALAAGCTAICKSAQETPLTSALFVKVLEEAGFPKGTVNLLHSSSAAPISEALMSDPRLRKVSFTGSTKVGSVLLSQSAPNILNRYLELGGDGPFIVFDDAEIDMAVEQANVCKLLKDGQACVAANRIIVYR